MAASDPPGIAFLDDEGNELRPDEVGDDVGSERAFRRRARVEQWLPDGGGAAIAAVVFVLVAWIGASPLVMAFAALAPNDMRQIGAVSDDAANFGTGQYFGVTPGLIPVISFGTRALLALIALVLAFRARRREHSAMAAAAVATASISFVLFLAGGVLMTIGLALGHGAGVYGVPF